MQNDSPNAAAEDLLVAAIGRSAWRRRKALAIAAAITLAIGVLMGWTTQLRWAATARILPPAGQSSQLPFDFASLRSMTGLRLGSASAVELYPAVFFSDAVLLAVLDRRFALSDSSSVSLIDEWGGSSEAIPEIKKRVALNRLRRAMTITTDRKSDVVTLTIQTRDPALSMSVANAIIDHAEIFHQTSATASATSQRAFIELRLGELSDQVYTAEQALLHFRSSNRDISRSPVAQMEYERLTRELAIQSSLYTEMRKHLEIAKVEEARNTPILRILDRAAPAVQPANSKMRTAVVSFLLGLAACASIIVIIDITREARRDRATHIGSPA
ncbi:MAG: hypothetical protein IPH48_07250 [bacterium]|nr:hypothetical protein [bacterium]